MDKDTSITVWLKPGFVLLVFGGAGYILFSVVFSMLGGMYELFTFLAWFVSLIFLALRGHWTPAEHAFETDSADLIASCLVIVGLLFLLFVESTNAIVFMLLLALPWYCASSFSQAVDTHKLPTSPFGVLVARVSSLFVMLVGRMVDFCFSVVYGIVFFFVFEKTVLVGLMGEHWVLGIGDLEEAPVGAVSELIPC